MAKYVVARTDDLLPGQRLIVDVRGRSIGLFNIDGEFFALRNSCPHEGGPVCEGDIVGSLESDRPRHYRFDPAWKFVQCPWHNWEYDIRTGQSWFDPGANATRRYEVSVESGSTLAAGDNATDDRPTSGPQGYRRGPYVAEMYDISVENDYLVLTI